MRNPFTARRPWVVFLLAFVAGPYLAMLFIGRVSLVGLYLLTVVLAGIVSVLGYPHWFETTPLSDVAAYFQWPIILIGSCHAAYLAWKRPIIPPARWYSRWYTIVGLPAAYVLLLLANRAFLYPFYYIPSHAMEPTIGVNDVVFGSRLAYRFREPARGDVVTFSRPGNVVFVKRIIGLPGDRVALRAGIVILNGEPLRQTAPGGLCCMEKIGAVRHRITPNTDNAGADVAESVVPVGHYYLLGDNRAQSLDSRFEVFGEVTRKDLIGPVVFRAFDGKAWRFVLQSVH